MTGSSGKEESRQAKHGFRNWSVEGSEGIWQQVSGRWYPAALTVCSGLNSCSRAHVCRQSAELLGTRTRACNIGRVPLCTVLSLPCCCAGTSALLSASPSQSCESGPFNWGQAVVSLISCGPQWFSPLSSEVFVQINTCKWNQWR